MSTQIYLHLGVWLAGVASFLSPCVLPLVGPYLGYLGGTTIEEMRSAERLDEPVLRRVVLSAVVFVLGFTTVFVILGAGASVLGQLMQSYKAELSIVAGTIIILFGLHFIGILRIPLLYRDARVRADAARGGPVGAYMMGLAFAFGWTPCIGPVLATVLTLAANEASMAAGVRLLLVYSLGLGLPFILAALAIGPFLRLLSGMRGKLAVIEKALGAVLVVTGVLILTGYLNWMGGWLLDTFPALGAIEEAVTDKRLQTEILKQGTRQ